MIAAEESSVAELAVLAGIRDGGVAGGVALALNVETIIASLEQFLGYQFLPADVYYISSLPSDLHWNDVTVIAITAFILSLISTIYPSWRAAQTRPAEALRYD